MEEKIMKFWKDNKADAETDWPVQAVADAFCTAMTHGDWPSKLANWPLDRTLRDWLTDPDGFSATWTDENGFAELHAVVRSMIYPPLTRM
jgi:hypothetical protein